MIDLGQWRASIGLHNAASSRALARILGKSHLTGSSQQLAEKFAMMLASLLRERFGQCQLLIDMICYILLIGVLMCVAAFNCKHRQTDISDVLHGGWFLSVSLLQMLPGDMERSLSALAILLIMAGDVEQNPGPDHHGTYMCTYTWISPQYSPLYIFLVVENSTCMLPGNRPFSCIKDDYRTHSKYSLFHLYSHSVTIYNTSMMYTVVY